MERKEILKNNYEIVFPEVTDITAIAGAVNVINHFSQGGLMLPATMDHYTALAQRHTLVVAKSITGQIIGTAGYTQFFDHDIWEFGGWTVAEEHQKSGVGKDLIIKLFSQKPHFKTIAFANKNSAPIFEKLGASLITDHSILPTPAFELCSTCPVKPASGCCDRIYNLEPVVAKLAMPDVSWMTPRQTDRLVYGLGENQSTEFSGFGKQPKDWK